MSERLEQIYQQWQQQPVRQRRLVVGAALLLVAVFLLQRLLPALAESWQLQQQRGALLHDVEWLYAELQQRRQMPGDCVALVASLPANLPRTEQLQTVAARSAIALTAPTTGSDSWQAQAASGDVLLKFMLFDSSCLGVDINAGSLALLELPEAGAESGTTVSYRASFTLAGSGASVEGTHHD